jgi:hypothetical protein
MLKRPAVTYSREPQSYCSKRVLAKLTLGASIWDASKSPVVTLTLGARIFVGSCGNGDMMSTTLSSPMCCPNK